MAAGYPMVWICCILFNRHVDDFQSLAIINSAAGSRLVQSKFVTVQAYLRDKFLKVEMPGQRVLTFVILRNAAKLLFMEVMPGYTVTRTGPEPVSPSPWLILWAVRPVDFGQSYRLKTVSQCNFNFFSFYEWAEVCFPVFDHLNFFLCKPFSYPLPTFLFSYWLLTDL